ncbi:MAG: FkbM family methyltransferase, partial [Actinomycetia bacterium]|nr:FkbM family methyltransferase [Actinomycetes bacterium]
MKKIFIDIGSYTGDTLLLALKNRYDIIHCFEPVQKHYQKLIAQVAAAGLSTWVIIHPYGLYSQKMKMDIFAAGSDGASIFQEKKQFQYQNIVEKCYFRRASEFFSKFITGDLMNEQIHMKINAEGAEIAILNDLIVNHQLNK